MKVFHFPVFLGHHTMKILFLTWLLGLNFFLCVVHSQNVSYSNVTDALENAAYKQEDLLIRDDLDSTLSNARTIKLLDLNTATIKEFESLGVISKSDVDKIIMHRDSFGNFISEYELQTFLDLPTVLRLAPFVTCFVSSEKTQLPFKQWFLKGNFKLMLRTAQRLERANGYDTTKTKKGYLGDPLNNFIRLDYSFKNLVSYGITFKKESGEPYKNGFDFTSAYIQVNNISPKIKTICLGDYAVTFGQGLILNSGFSLGKGSAVLNIEKNKSPVQAYSGSDETHFMRGAALQYRLTNTLELITFASYRRRDATVYDYSALTTQPTEPFVTVFELTGFHRTQTEIANKNDIGLTSVGFQLKKNYYYGSIAINAAQQNFDTRIQPPNDVYNAYHFAGKSLANISLNYTYTYYNAHFFGETALSAPGTWATINGMLLSLDKKLSISVLQRYYDKNYQTEGARSFGENTRTQNESGLYIGAEYDFNKDLIFSVYADVWQYAAPKFNVSTPSDGHEYFFKTEYKQKFEVWSLQFRNHSKQENKPLVLNEKVHDLIDKMRNTFTLLYANKFTHHFAFQERLDACTYSEQNITQFGFALSSNLNFHALENKFILGVHAAYFDTPNYQTAIFVYEDNIQNATLIEPYYYNGVRFASTARYNFVRGNTLELRAAVTEIFNKTSIGSGLETINASHKTDIALQWHFAF